MDFRSDASEACIAYVTLLPCIYVFYVSCPSHKTSPSPLTTTTIMTFTFFTYAA
jgi:hypothetical protein